MIGAHGDMVSSNEQLRIFPSYTKAKDFAVLLQPCFAYVCVLEHDM